jgi:hypothetical protein
VSTEVSADVQVCSTQVPKLDRSRGPAQLIVDGLPFLVRGVELHNSSSSSKEALANGLESARMVGANTVLAAVAWEAIEPLEGTFQLASVTELVESTRRAGLRLIILWFGAWKNGASTYAPAWVKHDWARFSRCVLEDGSLTDTLSPFTEEALDAPAFAEVMRHIESIDGEERTVLMAQVENEAGLLGASRDHSHTGNAAYSGPVPPVVVDVMASRPGAAQGGEVGSWPDVLPSPDLCDEAFMAYGIATHVERVAKAGRQHSALPFFVNAWLDSDLDIDLPGFAVAGGQRPGNYPSGGPLPHVSDIWRACAPSIDLLAPDLYFGDSRTIFGSFLSASGALFVPEMRRDVTGVGHIFEAIGEFGALGVSPFGVDSGSLDDLRPLTDAYDLLARAEGILCDAESAGDDRHGFFLTDAQPEAEFVFSGVRMTVTRVTAIGIDPTGTCAYGLIRQLGPRQFAAVGRGFRITFAAADEASHIGMESVEEILDTIGARGGRTLNGDETAGGTAWIHPHTEPMSMAHFPIPMGHAHSGISICRTYAYPRKSH